MPISLKGILEDSRAIEAINRELMGHIHLLLAYMMLALVSGFFGVLLSPLHLCLLLSNAYFKTTLAPVYRLLWQPCTILILAAGVYFELMSSLLGR